jgi:hypothetical protein
MSLATTLTVSARCLAILLPMGLSWPAFARSKIVPNLEWMDKSGMLGFLAACGVFGEAMKQAVIAKYRRDHGQVSATEAWMANKS